MNRVTVPEDFLEYVSDVLHLLSEYQDAKDWKEVPQNEFYYICKVHDWVDEFQKKKENREFTNWQYRKTIGEILSDENYEPPYDLVWDEFDYKYGEDDVGSR